ncbi:MAG: HAMP domain-containing histidine kinase [Verrucomicrobiales bacterium]|jgi:signal transduction histidine kinase|nr:HAMP domain-containing histidine kinase [Verrucomicrobiales bacterium]
MKKTAIIFVLAIFLPTVVLGVLALQAARQQRALLQNQQAQLWQQNVDNLATQIDLAVRIEQENFVKAVNTLTTIPGFSVGKMDDWSWYGKGELFVIGADGEFLSPAAKEKTKFSDADAFLTGRVAAEVYQAEPAALKDVQQNLQVRNAASQNAMVTAEAAPQAAMAPVENMKMADAAKLDANDEVRQSSMKALRKVAPQVETKMKSDLSLAPQFSKVERSRFDELVKGKSNGIISRYVDDRLEVLFWTRQEKFPGVIFGVRLTAEDLRGAINQPLRDFAVSDPNLLVTVLDDRAKPFTETRRKMNWSRPFVAAEIGDVLPHWEVAAYLLDAENLTRSARLTSWTLMAIIGLSLMTIAFGGWLVARDTRRQLELVRKKTDFVSNVSHELKTPLTSIRMFAELLQQGRVQEPEKVSRYLRIITAEAERLTRLINNVLDFSRSERKKKVYHMAELDLHAVIRAVWENLELHLREQGFAAAWHEQDGVYPVHGDADALAQVLVNLLSNAEKYSPERKEIELHTYTANGEIMISVLDRGMGVPAGDERKIFEQFYRAHDSLANGIGGSGLGLTLAVQIAEAHGGRITYERRRDGGSNFTLRLPLMTKG